MQLVSDYNLVGKIQYFINQENYHLISTDYTDTVTFDIIAPVDHIGSFHKQLADISNGTLSANEIKKVYFALIDGKIHLF